MIKVCLHLYLALLPKAWQPQDMDISHLFCKMQLIIVPNGGGGGGSLQAQLYYQFEKIKKIKCFAISSLKNTFFTMRK